MTIVVEFLEFTIKSSKRENELYFVKDTRVHIEQFTLNPYIIIIIIIIIIIDCKNNDDITRTKLACIYALYGFMKSHDF
jgi:hypothetical protein